MSEHLISSFPDTRRHLGMLEYFVSSTMQQPSTQPPVQPAPATQTTEGPPPATSGEASHPYDRNVAVAARHAHSLGFTQDQAEASAHSLGWATRSSMAHGAWASPQQAAEQGRANTWGGTAARGVASGPEQAEAAAQQQYYWSNASAGIPPAQVRPRALLVCNPTGCAYATEVQPPSTIVSPSSSSARSRASDGSTADDERCYVCLSAADKPPKEYLLTVCGCKKSWCHPHCQQQLIDNGHTSCGVCRRPFRNVTCSRRWHAPSRILGNVCIALADHMILKLFIGICAAGSISAFIYSHCDGEVARFALFSRPDPWAR